MIVVINYGMGNLRSVVKTLEKAGADVLITSDSNEIEKARGIVLPGVGEFSKTMENLKKLNILETLSNSILKGIPYLGICLGLQLLFTESEEGNGSQGLNIIKGKVKRFVNNMKIPHMGWNQIKIRNKKCKILEEIPDNSYFYFAHSYYAIPEDKHVIVATTDYGIEFVSIIQKGNILGTQFHPEKSSELGLKIIKNFCQLVYR
jgi:glutamine amidotransferase